MTYKATAFFIAVVLGACVWALAIMELQALMSKLQ